MKQNKIKLHYVIPVLMSFFVMSFIDLVGTGVDELKKSADTPAYILQLIPFVAFIWFFLLSVPLGIWQDKSGKRKVLNIGMLITAAGLLLPLLGNTLPVILLSFSVLGIGNTILQVSANPLLVDVVPTDKSSSFLSLSQFFKSSGSMIGPLAAAFTGPQIARLLGDNSDGAWRYGLYLFGLVSLLAWGWLSSVKIEESGMEGKRAGFKSCFKLLGNSYVLMMVAGVFMVVGIDVAMNSNIGTFLELKINMNPDDAKFGKLMYFFAKMIGTFIGAVLLTKLPSRGFLIGSAVLTVPALLALAFVPNELTAWVLIFIVSLGVSNIFPLIFSVTVGQLPERANEISGLMMMAVSGGALIPFLVGALMNIRPAAGMFILAGCTAYLVFIGLKSKA